MKARNWTRSSKPHEQERVLFETFLMTGMRELELMHLSWRDIDLTHGVVRVRHKPDFGWTPKAYKEREIPIPDKLVLHSSNGRQRLMPNALWSSRTPIAPPTAISCGRARRLRNAPNWRRMTSGCTSSGQRSLPAPCVQVSICGPCRCGWGTRI